MQTRKWKLKTFDGLDYNFLNTDLFLCKMLEERGIEKPSDWLYVKDDSLHSAELIGEIESICQVFDKLRREPETIYIQQDADADGITSAAILCKLIEDLTDCVITIGFHPNKEHGLNLKEAIANKATTVFVPDASGRPEDFERLAQKGVTTCIIDHHEGYAKEDYPGIVINCNHNDYPNTQLCGASLTFKVCEHYCQSRNIEWKSYNMAKALAAVGTITDMMTLKVLENKAIVAKGLRYIAEIPLFTEFVRNNNGEIPNPITVKNIGWGIGPSLNAVVRLGDMELKEQLFMAIVDPMQTVPSTKRGDVDVKVPVYIEVARKCRNLTSKQRRLVKNSLSMIEETLDHDSSLLYYIDVENELPFELSGIMANKIMDKYKKPTLILKHFADMSNPNNIGEACWAGSARFLSVEGFERPRDIINEITGIHSTGGHQGAFGIKIYQDSFPAFLCHAQREMVGIDFSSPLLTVELDRSCEHISKELMEVLSNEMIWSNDITKPLVHLSHVPLKDAVVFGADGEYTKIVLPQFDVVGMGDREFGQNCLANPQKTIEVVGEFDIYTNKVTGERRFQFVIKQYDFEDTAVKPVAIFDF